VGKENPDQKSISGDNINLMASTPGRYFIVKELKTKGEKQD
jgi:hypothetical protein